jgi:type II secretory pathway pseudopilin PulG
VVISIISLLSSVVLTSLNDARAKARDSVRKSTLKQLQIAIEAYYADNGSYPGTLGYFSNLTTLHSFYTDLVPKYISMISNDMVSGKNYIYHRKDNTVSGACFSLGVDKYSFYAFLEKPSAADLATVSDSYDTCVKGLVPTKINYRIGN